MSRLASDAGVTLLEVVVVLAILAAMTVAISASIRPPNGAPKGPTLAAQIAAARYEAVLSGTPQLLELDQSDGNILGDLVGSPDTSTVTLVAYPDGSLSTIPRTTSKPADVLHLSESGS